MNEAGYKCGATLSEKGKLLVESWKKVTNRQR